MVNHQCSAKQIFGKHRKFIFCTDQCMGDTDDTCFLQHIFFIENVIAFDGCQWQECCTSKLIGLQIPNHGLCSLLIVGNDILNASSKGCFNGNLIVFLYLNQICHNAQDSASALFLLHDLTDRVSITIIALCQIL